MERRFCAVDFATPLQEAWTLMHRERLRALPVLDRARRVIGLVTLDDFLAHAGLDPSDPRTRGQRLRAWLAPTPGVVSHKAEVVGQIMQGPVPTFDMRASMLELIAPASDPRGRPLLVVDPERRLAGLVSPADLIAALHRSPFEAHRGPN